MINRRNDCFSPEQKRMAFIIGHGVKAAPRGEIHTAGLKDRLFPH